MRIPCKIINEHNEAYAVWMEAAENGIIASRDNCLLHIDHHDDMEQGGYACDFEALPSPEQMVREVLGIADFIVPAIYQGLFRDVVLMTQLLPFPAAWQERCVSYTAPGTLLCVNYMPMSHAAYKNGKRDDGKHRYFRQTKCGASPFESKLPVVLDIDYDYFAWDDSLSSVPEKLMEVTREGYLAFMENPYHPFRILPKRLLDMVERQGRYYLRYRESIPSRQPPKLEILCARIAQTIKWLQVQDIQPQLVTLCRSCYSGYTPAESWQPIEEILLEELSALYTLDIE